MALVPNGVEPREGVHDIEMRFLVAQDGRPSYDQLAFQKILREQIHQVAQNLNANVEDSRAKSIALTHLEDALLWAGKAIFA